MTDIIEKNEYAASVPLIEVGEDVLGGVAGPSNKQATVLASRTNYLKNQVNDLKTKIESVPGYVTETQNNAVAAQSYSYDIPGVTEFNLHAFALKEIITDVAGVPTSDWILQTQAEVEIRWKHSQVSFKPSSAGNYKFNYQTTLSVN